MRTALALVLALASVLGTTSASAAPPRPWVLVVVSPETQPLSRRLQQEIEALGLRVRVVTSDQLPPSELEAAGAAARAVIHLETGTEGVELSIADRQTGGSSSWHLGAASDADPGANELLATRTVELLRARLLEIAHVEEQPPPRPEPAPPSPAPKAPAPAATSGQHLAVWVGPTALYSATFRPGASLQGALVWMPVSRFGLTLNALAPLAPPHLGSPQGSVDAYASIYRAGLVLEAVDPRGPVALRLAGGIELARLRLQGHAQSPYRAHADDFWLGAPWVSLAPRFRLSSSLRVLAEVALAWPSPTTVVRIVEREAARWGSPLGTASLGLELELPL